MNYRANSNKLALFFIFAKNLFVGQKLAHFILNNRIYILIGIVLLTAFMGYKGKDVELAYQMPRLLPSDHKDIIAYEEFKGLFGLDGFQVVIGVQDDEFFTKEKYETWKKMGDKFMDHPSVDSVYSEANLYIIKKNDSLKRFELDNIPGDKALTQHGVDSIKNTIRSYPFYESTIYNDSSHFHVMLLMVNVDYFNSNKRGEFSKEITQLTKEFEGVYKSEFYLTGLPFIRASNMRNIKSELKIFLFLSLLATILVLFFFFRSFNVIVVAVLIVGIGVVFSMGILGVLEYKISAIMGLLPPLIIVIGIPNCVYLINKYQQVFLETRDKELALKTVIVKIGHITLLTNATTAFGLGTFIFTDTPMLIEFGITASICILLLFGITVLLVPILFSFLPEPKDRQTKHLEKGWLAKFLELLNHLVSNKRKLIYITTVIVIAFSIYGAMQLQATGRMIDDLPNGQKPKNDLVFFQDNLSGVMPFELLLDVKKKGKYQKSSVLKKIDSVQRYLETYPEIQKTISMVDALKFVNQAFYNGNPDKYQLPKGRDKAYIKKYIKKNKSGGSLSMSSYIDSTGTKTRISTQVEDFGIARLDSLLLKAQPEIDNILNPDKVLVSNVLAKMKFENSSIERDLFLLDSLITEFGYIESSYIAALKDSGENELAEQWYDEGMDYEKALQMGKTQLERVIDQTYIDSKITGFIVPFTKGTKYLIFNLFISLLIAIIGISILMSFLFRSFWMVVITIVTNLIPLVFTAGIMGYFGVSLKPSTILVFSISLGIAVDDAIHYLAKYKQELKASGGNVKVAVYAALRETGISMLYTSIILFFGFSIFMASSYGGTQALGLLISVTLLIAMLSNLVLLPSLLLAFSGRIEKK